MIFQNGHGFTSEWMIMNLAKNRKYYDRSSPVLKKFQNLISMMRQ